MHRKILATASVFGATGVLLGAFGAHGLQRVTSDEKILHGYQTGVQYQLYHALALLILALLAGSLSSRWINWAFTSFVSGMILFSGSLYLLTYLRIEQSAAIKWVGPITPFGGILLIAGWLFLLFTALDRKRG